MNARLSVALRVGCSSYRRSLSVHPQTPRSTTAPIVSGLQTLVISSPPMMMPTHSGWWWALVMTHSSNAPHLQKTRMVEGEEERVSVCDWLHSFTVTVFSQMCLSHFILPNKLCTLGKNSSSLKCDLPQAAMSRLHHWLVPLLANGDIRWCLAPKLVEGEWIFLLPWLRVIEFRFLSSTIPRCADFSVLRGVKNTNLFMPH